MRNIVASSVCRNFSSGVLGGDWHSVANNALRCLWAAAKPQQPLSHRLFSTRPSSEPRDPEPAKRVTVPGLFKKYLKGEKISMITAYDFNQAKLVDKSPIDVILVGDSVGMTMLGHQTTVPVEVSDIIYHCKAVSKGARRPLLVGDMPFGSYEVDLQEGCKNALRIIKEGGVHAVKLEGGKEQAPLVKALTRANISVMGHIGLQPQSVNTLGNYRYVGNTPLEAKRLMEDALALQEAGCFALVLECVPEELSAYVTKHLAIPTIGIGAGRQTSGQVLVWHDMLGLSESCPSFCKQFINLREIIEERLGVYHKEVSQGNFPTQDNVRALKNSKTLQMIAEDSLFPEGFVRKAQEQPNDVHSEELLSVPVKINHAIPERILVIGSGAMGLLVAGKLASGLGKISEHCKVVVYDPWYDANVNSIKTRGLQFQVAPNGPHEIISNISATCDEEELLRLFDGKPADVAIVLSKSYQLQQQPEKVAFDRLVARKGVICTLQNGYGNKQVLQQVCLPTQTVLIGTTSNGCKLIGNGAICQSGTGPTFIVCKDHRDANDAGLVSHILNLAGISTQVTDNEEVILEKIIINAAINPISALLEVTNGKIVQEAHLFDQIIEKVVEEGVRLRPNLYPDAVSRKKRVRELVAKVKLVAQNTSQNRSSMLSDISRGRDTEIDFINGFLVKESQERGYEAPTNALLMALVKAKAASK